MVREKERTMDLYMKAGAEMRLYKTLGTQLYVDIAPVVYKADLNKLYRAQELINEVCSKVDGYMFNDHPEISNAYTRVFYGTTAAEPRDDVDKEMLAKAREVADKLFER